VAAPPAYFFDTSALLKRYHAEPGTDTVDAAFAAPSIRIASDLGLIELISSLARRVRMQEITRQDFQAAKAAIAKDTQADGVLRVEAVGEADKAEAARLLERYGLTQELRTLDALHLAVMRRLGPASLDAVYCADRRLIAILEAEGFTVINPETI
jgi:predicted nucleic acid-binding protein